jgi:hypothetical protein
VTSGNGSSSSSGDPIGDFQRWLMRSSAKSLGRELKDQFRRATGGSSQSRADVWETATTEPPVSAEAPECAWCPICRAARRARQSGPGLASQVAGAGDALFGIAQDALAAFDATLSARPPAPPAAKPPAAPPARAQTPGEGPRPRTPEGTGWPDEDVGRPSGSPPAQGTDPGGPDHRPPAQRAESGGPDHRP